MLLFGHGGITLGAAILVNGILAPHSTKQAAEQCRLCATTAAVKRFHGNMAAWAGALGKWLDLRLLLIGSLLPDIIDKPTGQLLFRETFHNGRIFAHTLLFLMLIASGGLYLYRRYGCSWLLVLGAGSGMHLILDAMWLAPGTLFWPLYGFSFAAIDLTQWLPNILRNQFTAPAELAGLVILVWFAWLLVRSGRLYAFIRYGQT